MRPLFILVGISLAISMQMVVGGESGYSVGQVQMQITATEQYCSFFNNRAPSRQPTLKNCTWFKENSCCLQREIDATFGKVKPLQGASEDCQRYMNYLMCYICAPNQNLFYSGGELSVCNDFCDKFYEACSSAILKGYVISELYNSGYDFCKSRQYRVGSYTDIRCFRYSDFTVRSSSDRARSGASSRLLLIFLVLCSLNLNFSTADLSLPRLRPGKTRFQSLLSCGVALFLVWVFVYPARGVQAMIRAGDVSHFAAVIGDDLTKLTADVLQHDKIQARYDTTPYDMFNVNGTANVAAVREKLGE